MLSWPLNHGRILVGILPVSPWHNGQWRTHMKCIGRGTPPVKTFTYPTPSQGPGGPWFAAGQDGRVWCTRLWWKETCSWWKLDPAHELEGHDLKKYLPETVPVTIYMHTCIYPCTYVHVGMYMHRQLYVGVQDCCRLKVTGLPVCKTMPLPYCNVHYEWVRWWEMGEDKYMDMWKWKVRFLFFVQR